MALLVADEEGDLMPILGEGYDTYVEYDPQGDIMPRLEPVIGNYPDEDLVQKDVVYGPQDELTGLRGEVVFDSVPQTTDPV